MLCDAGVTLRNIVCAVGTVLRVVFDVSGALQKVCVP